MRTTIGTPTPQRYRIFAALLTSWLKPVATKSLNCISPIGRSPASAAPMQRAEHGALGERRVEDAIAVLLEQRPQQQKRVAVLAADVLAEHERARIGVERVADAVHDGFEERHALLVERRRVLDGERRRRWPACGGVALEHLDARRAASDRRRSRRRSTRGRIGPRRRDDGPRLGLDHRLGLVLHELRARRRSAGPALRASRVGRESDRARARTRTASDPRSPAA